MRKSVARFKTPCPWRPSQKVAGSDLGDSNNSVATFPASHLPFNYPRGCVMLPIRHALFYAFPSFISLYSYYYSPFLLPHIPLFVAIPHFSILLFSFHLPSFSLFLELFSVLFITFSSGLPSSLLPLFFLLFSSFSSYFHFFSFHFTSSFISFSFSSSSILPFIFLLPFSPFLEFFFHLSLLILISSSSFSTHFDFLA